MRTGSVRQTLVCLLSLTASACLGTGLATTVSDPAFSLEIQKPADNSQVPAPPPVANGPATPCATANCPPNGPTPPANGQTPSPPAPIPSTDAASGASGPDVAVPDAQLKGPVEVFYDIKKAPPAVAKMRERIVEAAASGDISRLKELLNPGPNQTEVSIGEHPEDPVAELKSLSGDEDGIEILAILLDILSTGYVHVGQGTKDEVYVWPYFAEKPLSTLTPPERVELLRLVTAGDVADMKEFGGYNFYRVGISHDGSWKFFVAGN